MTYCLQADETYESGLRRIAYEQISYVLDCLQKPGDEPDEAIHEARKSFKKMRALLRLVRDELSEDVYRRENICFRDAGRHLALTRDSLVMFETLAELKQKHDDNLAATTFTHAQDILAKSHELLLAEAFAPHQSVDQVIGMMEEARERIAEWPLEAGTFAAIAPSLRRVYKRGYRGRQRTKKRATAENLHEWRKRVKYLWYGLRLLCPLWPKLLATVAAEVDELAGYLGHDHDLAVLGKWAEKQPSLFPNEFELLMGLIQQERHQLQMQAMPLGQRIYAEKPKQFVKRMARYGQVWAASEEIR